MQIFLNSTDINIPPYALTAKLDGYSINIFASNILSGEGYNGAFMATLRKKIKELGKPVNPAILFGGYSTEAIYSKFPFVDFIMRHHRGVGDPKRIKMPVPFAAGYMDKLREVVEFFSDELKKDASCYDLIEAVTVTGINENTKEMRFTSQHWKDSSITGTQAYIDGAQKWIDVGYTPEKALGSVCATIDIFKNFFPDKKIILPYIPLLNGVPCVSHNGSVCKPKERPYTAGEAIDYGNGIANFKSQYTAFTNTTVTPSKYVQCNKVFYTDKTTAEFQAMIDYAIATGVENLEVHAENLLRYPSIFK